MAQLENAITVAALPGELIDQLVWRALGKAGGAIEIVLAANPGVPSAGHALAPGQQILIPAEADAPVGSDLVQLWS